MKKPTFEQIPQAIADLQAAVAELKQILINTPKKSNNKPLNIKEAAAFINMSVPSLYGLVSNRKIPFHKGNKKLYFFENELIEWLTGKENKTKSQKKVFKISKPVVIQKNKPDGSVDQFLHKFSFEKSVKNKILIKDLYLMYRLFCSSLQINTTPLKKSFFISALKDGRYVVERVAGNQLAVFIESKI